MKVIILSTSIRNSRNTHRVALYLHKLLSAHAGCFPELIDLADYKIPIWEEVITKEENPPQAILELKMKLDEADAMIMVTPEYNGSYSLALKNVIDYFGLKTFERKSIGVVSVTIGSLGGIRAGLALQQLILAVYAFPVPQMLLVSQVQQRFSENGDLLEEAFGKQTDKFINEFYWLSQAIFHHRQAEVK